jgi:gamma-glutamyl-gamma-aminobutyrate hydrolase PuuD
VVKPVIGISGDVKTEPEPIARLKLSYIDAVRRAGGVPVILPACSPEDVAAMLERVDAVVLTGGDDIDPRARGVELHHESHPMHPRRQAFEYALACAVLERPKPTLGICLGLQMIAFASGAPLHQHLPDAGIDGLVDHRDRHDVEIEPDSRLAAILGTHHANVISHHHQAIARVPAPFRQVARAPDGVIEGIELPGERFLVAVQWHPERDPNARETERLFEGLVAAARDAH